MPTKIQHSPRAQYLDADELQQIVSMNDGSLDPAWATSRILVFPSTSKTVKQHLQTGQPFVWPMHRGMAAQATQQHPCDIPQ